MIDVRGVMIATLLVSACTEPPPTVNAGAGSASTTTHGIKKIVSGLGGDDGGFACVLFNDGRLLCWGETPYAETAVGRPVMTPADYDAPTTHGGVDIGTRVIDVAAGSNHVCALLISGDIKCWGRNHVGQLGYGDTADRGKTQTPRALAIVPLPEKATAVAAGNDTTCAVLQSGRLLCWGDNQNGLLGLGNTAPVGDDESVATLTPLDFGSPVRQVSVAESACVVLDDGEVHCWGSNAHGQLGVGRCPACGSNELAALGDDEPIIGNTSAVDLQGQVAEIAGADDTWCARFTDGRVRCWGSNDQLQLGIQGTVEDIGDDEPVSAGADVHIAFLNAPAVSLTIRGAGICAALDNGNYSCWGRLSSSLFDPPPPAPVNGAEQIQIASLFGNELLCAHNSLVSRCWEPTLNTPIHYEISSLDPVSVSLNYLGTCWLDGGGGVRCFGHQRALGESYPEDLGDDEPPGLARLAVRGQFTYLNSGGYYDSCSQRREPYNQFNLTSICWGDTGEGDFDWDGENLTLPAIDGEMLCGVFDGDIECRGKYDGPGSWKSFDMGHQILGVASGQGFHCAHGPNQLYCWGRNNFGQLGQAHTNAVDVLYDSHIPQQVPLGGAIKKISLGNNHTCVLFDSGDVRCWGRNQVGQLGLGHTDNQGDDEYPSQNALLSGAANDIATGDDFTCALLNGAVYCWGQNTSGQLGTADSATVSHLTQPPAQPIPLPETVTSIAAGGNRACAITTTHKIYCWGAIPFGPEPIIGDDEAVDPAGLLRINDFDLDGEPAVSDFDPYDANSCSDLDVDGCDDCISGQRDLANDGLDSDGDGLCDVGDTDDDNDGVLDSDDVAPTDPYRCADVDSDYCDDCAKNGIPTPGDDGLDSNGDGTCDRGDDADGDGVANGIDPNYLDNFECGDADGDRCDDCGVVGTQDTQNDGFDVDADGICDRTDDSDGDGISDENEILLKLPYDDGDADDDGILDGDELFPGDDTDEDGLKNALDFDSDGDGLPDGTEIGLTTSDIDLVHTDLSANHFRPDADAGQTVTNPLNRDSDGGGVPDGLEDANQNGAVDANETSPDIQADDAPDLADNEGDTIINMIEGGGDHDQDGTKNLDDDDADGDTIPDIIEVVDPNDPIVSDNRGYPDFLDVDADDDGIYDKWEAGDDPMQPLDSDGSGIPDYREIDADDDGLSDTEEAGIDLVANPGAEPIDWDGDGKYDFQDPDSDNDGILDFHEKSYASLKGEPPRHNLDSDGDGIEDNVEAGDLDPSTAPIDSDGDGAPDFVDLDSDNDGVLDGTDNCRTIANADQVNLDGDLFGSACDDDEVAPTSSGGCSGVDGSPAWLLCLLALIALSQRRNRTN